MEYSHKHPWAHNITEKYGLDLSLYDLTHETGKGYPTTILNGAHFIEDTCFLKTFEDYVKERLPQNFSSVLEVGVGLWTYVSAMATFFRKYNDQVLIIGIDRDSYSVNLARCSIRNRNVKGVDATLSDINY